MADSIAPVWRVQKPTEWPAAPDRMSFSTLLEIESCPRRWALTSATYAGIWDQAGYPERPQIRTLFGRISHCALQQITGAIAEEGCTSVRDPRAAAVLKRLGGYTEIISGCTEGVLADLTENPRAKLSLESVVQKVHSQIPHIRRQVQMFLSRLRLLGSSEPMKEARGRERGRLALRDGSYPEVVLKAPSLGWVGIADLINLSDTECEIVDFKTGEPHEKHSLQLRIYSLLWARDSESNPSGRLATKLTLSYPGGDIDVKVPAHSELASMEIELEDRTRVAVQAAAARPPEARPSIDNCRHCGVKKLCDAYWRGPTMQRLAQEAPPDERFQDVQLRVVGRHGPNSWNAVAEVSSIFDDGQTVILRVSAGEARLRARRRFRVLDAAATLPVEDESQPGIVSTHPTSEVYEVDSE